MKSTLVPDHVTCRPSKYFSGWLYSILTYRLSAAPSLQADLEVVRENMIVEAFLYIILALFLFHHHRSSPISLKNNV